MKSSLPAFCLVIARSVSILGAEESPHRFDLSARASIIDSRVREHPEIDFLFKDPKAKPTDTEHACVDTSIKPQGKLVIWLMGHNQPLFERLSSYGLHAIQVHYANGWFNI